MKTRDLSGCVTSFFCSHLTAERNLSQHTTHVFAAAPVARAAVPVGAPVRAAGIVAGPVARESNPFTTDGPVLNVSKAARSRRGGKAILLAGCVALLLIVAASAAALVALPLVGAGLWSRLVHDDMVLADKDEQPPADDGKDHGHNPINGAVKDRDKKPPKKDKGRPTEKSGLFPRRALLISVDNYLYLNSVHYGSVRSQSYPGSSIAALAASFPNPPLRIPATQVFELSDGATNRPHPTELTVIKNAIVDFLDTSRAQDRIVILFTGHGTEIDKDAYLIPISGRKDDASTLLPLAWVYEQMAKCKARQKVLILDLFRFPPALGFELPGAGASDEGEMGEVFDKVLQEPPAGVQVWSSCIKEQRSIEFDGGSVFLQAINQTLQKGPAMIGFIEGTSPLPFDQAFVDKVNQHIKTEIGPQKFVQTSRLTGSPVPNGADYDPAEPLALPITLKQPTAPGGSSASYAEINSILDELKMVPPTRRTRSGEDRLLQAVNLPPFPAKALSTYKQDDYKFLGELRDRYKKDAAGLAKKHPVRAVVLDAVEVLSKSNKIVMRETIGSNATDPKVKTAFLNDQREPGKMILELEDVLADMKMVKAKNMEGETSKRWRANFDYTMARLKARIVYIYEYSFMLGQIRMDQLPALEGGQDGWRIGSRKKIQVSEPIAKKYAKEVASAWREIQENYPDTPWQVLAYRESLVTLGLEWRAKKE